MVPGPSLGVDRDFYRTFRFTTSLHSGRLAGWGAPQAPPETRGRRKNPAGSAGGYDELGRLRRVGRESLRGRGLH
jgi:hypothetical protein